MDTIVTPVTVITLDSTRIVHSIKADLVARYFPPVVRLVQYDQSLPVIAVSMMLNGQTYTLPSGAAANIRVHKPDATYVYNPALGCDSTRNIVYFEVTQAMAAASGDGLAIVEIVVNGDIAGTSLITLHFEDNPVPEDAIESSDEWETIYELGERIIASTVTPVSTEAGMTDHNVVYLYTGTESGWNQGHMYYYNGSTWVDAGIAVTDTTLSVAGLAADAKATGDEITALKEDFLNSLITDTASGAIASFPDGAAMPVKSLSVDIEPVQDLHGQASPYPEGGGKNLLMNNGTSQTVSGITFTKNTDGSVVANGTSTGNIFYMIADLTLPSGTYILNGCPSGGSNAGYSLRITEPTSYLDVGNGVQFTLSSETTVKVRIVFGGNGGVTVNNLVFKPMIRLSSVSDSTFAPYSNICPISGHTQATVVRVGKNLLKNNGQNQTLNGITFTKNSDGSISVNGTSTGNAFYFIADITLPSGTYILNGCPSGGGNSAYSLRITEPTVHADFGSGTQFTLSEETTVKVRIVFGGGGGVVADNLTFKPMIRFASVSDATFMPYSAYEITTDLGGTRYRGVLDVTAGILTVDGAVADLGALTWNYNTSSQWFYTGSLQNNIVKGDTQTLPDILSSMYKTVTRGNIPNLNSGITLDANRIVIVKDLRYSDVSSFKTAMNGVQLVYALSEPFIVQLTLQEVTTLLGQNNIWSDAGTVEVEYRADTKLYINKMLNA